MCLHDWTKIAPGDCNSTPIIAEICIRLDIASPQHLDRLLFAFVLCFFTEKKILMSPRPPRTRHTHCSAARYMLNCKQQKAVVTRLTIIDVTVLTLSSNLMQVDTFC